MFPQLNTLYAAESFFEKCTRGNQYLEKEVSKLLKNTVPPQSQNCPNCQENSGQNRGKSSVEKTVYAIQPALNKAENLRLQRCIAASMKRGLAPDGRVFYGVCPQYPRQQMPNRVGMKPCVSENLVTLISNQYQELSRCLKLDPWEYFQVVNHESRFQVNIAASVAGIAQVAGATSVAASGMLSDDFYRNHTCRLVSETSKVAVQRKSRNSINASFCHRIAVPPNPARSFLEGMAIYQTYREDAKRWLIKWFRSMPLERRPTLSQAKKMLAEVTQANYNGGSGAVGGPFLRAVKYYEAELKQKETQATYDGFVGFFRKFLRNTYPGKNSKRIEVSRYSMKIEKDLQVIRQVSGTSCKAGEAI